MSLCTAESDCGSQAVAVDHNGTWLCCFHLRLRREAEERIKSGTSGSGDVIERLAHANQQRQQELHDGYLYNGEEGFHFNKD